MTEYALVGPGGEIKTYSRAVRPEVGTKAGWRWLPVERPALAFDPDNEVLGEEVAFVGDGVVTVARPARRKTEEERRQEAEDALEEELPLRLAAILCDLDNRLRAIERKAPRTPQEFRQDAIRLAR